MLLTNFYLAGIFTPGFRYFPFRIQGQKSTGSSRKFKYAYPQEGWHPIHHGQGQRQGLQLELHLAARAPAADFSLTPKILMTSCGLKVSPFPLSSLSSLLLIRSGTRPAMRGGRHIPSQVCFTSPELKLGSHSPSSSPTSSPARRWR